MTFLDARPTRRRWLLRASLILTATPVALLTGPARARAAAATAKADVSYQYTPKGDQHCGACASFIPGVSPKGPGTCKIVVGEIPQNGWCVLFSKR